MTGHFTSYQSRTFISCPHYFQLHDANPRRCEHAANDARHGGAALPKLGGGFTDDYDAFGLNLKTIFTPLEEREMTSYRLLWFDHAQHIILSKHVECRTDQAAIHLADRQVGDYERLEIWDGKRPVSIGGRPLSEPTLS